MADYKAIRIIHAIMAINPNAKVNVWDNDIDRIDWTIEYWDERYSSDVIFKEMRKSDFSTNKIKKKLDQQSAAYILQGYLDRYGN